MNAARGSLLRTLAVLFALLLPPAALALSLRALWPAPARSVASAAPPPVAAPAEIAEDSAPEIRGRVVDAHENPVAGAAVRLVSAVAPYAVLREARTDAAGAFAWRRLAAGRVRVIAEHEPAGIAGSDELVVTPGKTEDVTLVLSAAGAVAGEVVDEEDHPVAGATISVEGVAWKTEGVTTDAAGAFRMAAVPEQAASLVAVARGFKPARVPLARRQKGAPFHVRVVLVGAADVEGDVLDEDGRPVEANVIACAGKPGETSADSDEHGTFELPAATIGCDAIAQQSGYAPSDPVVISDGRLTLRLKTGGAIEGVVVDERGAAVPSFTLGIESFSIAHKGSQDRGPRTFDDPRGSFRWDKLAPGRYVLSASVEGRSPARSAGIVVSGGGTTRGVRIVVQQGGVVEGHVKDDHQQAVAGAEVAFDSVSVIVSGGGVATTDASGRFRLEGAPSGPLTIRVRKDGFRARLVSGLRVPSGGTLTQDVVLSAQGGGFEMGGIGANIALTDDGLVFAGLGPDDPGAHSGLQPGDRILTIDGESADGMSVADAVQRLRGQPGSNVGVTVLRPGSGDVVDVAITRATIVR